MNLIEKIIAASFLFQGLPESELTQLATIVEERKYSRREPIFFEGDAATGFYMVGQGQVKVFKMSLDGREQILHVFGPGEPFGEVPVFHGQPFPANATALVSSSLLYCPRQAFVDLLGAHPSLAMNMLAVLAKRLRRFATQVEHLSLKEVPGRLASHLLYLSREQHAPQTVTLNIPKGQLASLLGTTPETLSRIFAKLADEGIIQVRGRHIDILDREALQEREQGV